MHRKQTDNNPAVATQLRLLAPPPTETLLLHQAATLAARAVTEVLSGRGQRWAGRSIEISGVEAMGVERLWAPHPECLCSSLDAAEDAAEDSGTAESEASEASEATDLEAAPPAEQTAGRAATTAAAPDTSETSNSPD